MAGLVLGIAAAFAAITSFPRDASGSMPCGPLQVTWNKSDGYATLLVEAGPNSLLVDLSREVHPGERIIPRWCGDVLGDGTQVLALETFSGGAHCCFSASVIQLTKGAPHLLDVDLGNGGLGDPQQLDGTGAYQLIASSDVFAYFDDLPFYASPFLPLVYAYDGQEYVEATRAFPAYLQAQIARADADLATATQPLEQKSIALRLYGLHVLLGDPDSALGTITVRLSPEAAEWLNANAPAARAAVAAAYDLADQ